MVPRPVLVVTASEVYLETPSATLLREACAVAGRSMQVIGLSTIPDGWEGPMSRPDIPIELQPQVPADLTDDGVIVLLDPEAADAAISHRMPLICWDVPETRRGLSLRAMASVVVGRQNEPPAGCHRARYVEIGELDATSVNDLLDRATRPRHSEAIHRVVRAEIFDQLDEQSPGLGSVGSDVPDSVRRRFDGASRRRPGGRRVGRPGRSVVALAREDGEAFGSVESSLLSIMVSLKGCDTVDELLEHDTVKHSDHASKWAVRLAARRFIHLADEGNYASLRSRPGARTLLAVEGVGESIGFDDLVALVDVPGIPESFWRDVGRNPSSLKATVAVVALALRGDEELTPSEIAAFIGRIDDHAWHEGLWQAGLRYWEQADGSSWEPRIDPDAPPLQDVPRGDDRPATEVDETARSALAAGEHERAIAAFEVVRAKTADPDGAPVPTEIAARLNIGWALWDSGADRSRWEPYLSSALHEVMPPPEMVRLRNILALLRVPPGASEPAVAPTKRPSRPIHRRVIGRLRRFVGRILRRARLRR
jgi:hypothetical protein